MSVTGNKGVVRRWNEDVAWGGKAEAFDEVLDANYTIFASGESSWGPVLKGLEAAKGYFTGYSQKHPTFRGVIDDMIAEGDKVAIRATFYEEGKAQANIIVFYRLANGKIVDDWMCTRDLKH